MPASTTIKFLMIILFAAAGLVVARVGILINKTFHPAVARISQAVPLDYGDTNDFDHDGLDNGQEAIWGTDPYNPDSDGDSYLDGEEVVSDHNPLLAQEDSLAKDRDYLAMSSTQRLSQLIVGGLIAGDLKKENNPETYAQSIDAVAGSTVYSVLSALESVEIDENIPNIVSETTENQERYLQTLFSTISKNILELVYSQPKEVVLLFSPDRSSGQPYSDQQKERVKTSYLQHSVKFQEAYNQLTTTPVPKNWTAIHQKILTLLKKLELYHRSIALSTGDPIKQMIVLGNLQSVYLEAQPILLAIGGKIKSNQLKTPDNDFFNISLLINQAQ